MSERREHPLVAALKGQLADGRIGRRDFLRCVTLLGLSATSALTFAAGLGGGAAPSQAAAAQAEMPRGGRLSLGMRLIDVSSPHTYSWIWDSNIARQVCEYLTLTDHNNITRPYLLERWEPSEDLRSWTLTLRRGIAWHNGRELTADDVIWNLRRVLDPALGSSIVGLMQGYMLDDAAKSLWDANAIERLDSHSLRLNCKIPQLAVPEHLFHYPCLVLDPEEDGRFGPGANGTGAFELTDYEIGNRAVLRARPDYWGEGPYVDTLEFIDLGDDPTGEIEAMAARRLHGVDIVDIIQVEAFSLMEHLQMHEVVTASTGVMRGKVDHAPFDDPRVRQAMRLAVDCRQIQRLVHGDHGAPAEHHHVSPTQPEYVRLPFPERDLEKAKALLAEAGHASGIDLGRVAVGASPSWQFNAVQAIVEQWREAGLRAQIDLMPASDYWAIWDKAPLAFTGWVHRPLGVMTLGLGYRTGVPWNESGYSNPEFDRLLLEAEGLVEVEARREVMARLERILQEDGPIVQPLWRSEITFMDKRVRGFHMHPSTYIFGNELAVET